MIRAAWLPRLLMDDRLEKLVEKAIDLGDGGNQWRRRGHGEPFASSHALKVA